MTKEGCDMEVLVGGAVSAAAVRDGLLETSAIYFLQSPGRPFMPRCLKGPFAPFAQAMHGLE